MKLYIAKLGPAAEEEESVFNMMCVKYDAKSSILPAWFSREHGEIEIPKFTREEYRIEELDQEEYTELSEQHQKMGINLFLHIRKPVAEQEAPDAED